MMTVHEDVSDDAVIDSTTLIPDDTVELIIDDEATSAAADARGSSGCCVALRLIPDLDRKYVIFLATLLGMVFLILLIFR